MNKYESRVLKANIRQTVKFDPKNPEHLREFGYFQKNRRWKTSCPFHLEDEYISVPHMIADILSSEYIKEHGVKQQTRKKKENINDM